MIRSSKNAAEAVFLWFESGITPTSRLVQSASLTGTLRSIPDVLAFYSAVKVHATPF